MNGQASRTTQFIKQWQEHDILSMTDIIASDSSHAINMSYAHEKKKDIPDAVVKVMLQPPENVHYVIKPPHTSLKGLLFHKMKHGALWGMKIGSGLSVICALATAFFPPLAIITGPLALAFPLIGAIVGSIAGVLQGLWKWHHTKPSFRIKAREQSLSAYALRKVSSGTSWGLKIGSMISVISALITCFVPPAAVITGPLALVAPLLCAGIGAGIGAIKGTIKWFKRKDNFSQSKHQASTPHAHAPHYVLHSATGKKHHFGEGYAKLDLWHRDKDGMPLVHLTPDPVLRELRERQEVHAPTAPG